MHKSKYHPRPVECWVGYWFYKSNQFYSDAFMEDSKLNMIVFSGFNHSEKQNIACQHWNPNRHPCHGKIKHPPSTTLHF